ncbi:MAG: hypothetical protein SNJ29_12415 [Rikenellaceae bacterium]
MTIGTDKYKHFGVCFAVSFAGGLEGAIFAAGLAIGKEYGDKNAAGNHWCWWDMLADTLGIITGYGLRLICF